MRTVIVPSIQYANEVKPLRYNKHSNHVNIVLVNKFDLERLFILSEPQTSHLFNKDNNILLTATQGSYAGQMSYVPHKMSVLNKDLGMLWCPYAFELVT